MLNQKDLDRIEKFNREQAEMSKRLDSVADAFANIAKAGEDAKYFTCPICCKKYQVEEGVSCERRIKSEHVGTKFHMRYAEYQYRDTYIKFRICKKCNRKIYISKVVTSILCYIIFPILYVVYYFTYCPKYGIVNFILVLGLFYLAASIVRAIIIKFLEVTFFDIDSDFAAEHNAIEPYDSIF
jgi:hypothetical protein